MPARLIDESGDAPVPPESPEMTIRSARAFATPAAIVPTPASRDELHRDRRLRRDRLQVVDELRQIFDRIDVVVRRRRDQRHAGRRVAGARDDLVDLVPGQLAAFAGLRALRDLDLQLVGVDEILRRHAEARRRDLLDRAVALGAEARGIFAAFAGVAASAEPVHRDRERLVRFGAQRSERHRAGAEPTRDRARGLDLVDRDRRRARRKSRSPRSVDCSRVSSLASLLNSRNVV